MPIAVIGFTLALIARRRVRRGLALPSPRGVIGLALLVGGAQSAATAVLAMGLPVALFMFLRFFGFLRG
jgi:hypothetical protein